MNTIEEYFDRVRQLMQSVPGVQVERYEEYILSATRGNLRIRLRFADNALLEITELPRSKLRGINSPELLERSKLRGIRPVASEAFVLVMEELCWLSYRYHYQDAFGVLVLRYDNAPHYPEIATHPNHKHCGEQILASNHPSIEQLLEEVQTVRKPVM